MPADCTNENKRLIREQENRDVELHHFCVDNASVPLKKLMTTYNRLHVNKSRQVRNHP
jgi:hypothetical protein